MVSSFQSSSAFAAEAQAVRLATSLAQASNLSSITIESDNQAVIKLGASENVPPWEVPAILLDIRHQVNQCNLKLKWTRRVHNRAANWVATTYAKQGLPPSCWVSDPPFTLAEILRNDVMVS
ncbi:hypothetical protein CsSME_00023997 [Camellia sinensis var. sinensis]